MAGKTGTAKAESKPKIDSNIATVPQVKMIFGLAKSAGFETGEDAKEMVNNKFKLESFNDLTKSQASELIEELQEDNNKASADRAGEQEGEVDPDDIPF